jgi:hypothetical protein
VFIVLAVVVNGVVVFIVLAVVVGGVVVFIVLAVVVNEVVVFIVLAVVVGGVVAGGVNSNSVDLTSIIEPKNLVLVVPSSVPPSVTEPLSVFIAGALIIADVI